MSINLPPSSLPRVVIAGGGFAGLKLAQALDSSLFQIILIDHHNYHQFPPLIYQVASSGLEPSSPTCLSEVIHKPFTLSRVFLLSSGGKGAALVKKKAPSRSSFSVSMYVVLRTRHVNPNIHVHRFIVHVRSPNLSATRPELLSLHGATT